MIEVLILDSGKGIEAKDIAQIFNPFYTSCHGKAGLGLFVTRQIIHRYGGSIKAESRVGEGSLFILQLPVQVQHASGPAGANFSVSSGKRSPYEEEALSGG